MRRRAKLACLAAVLGLHLALPLLFRGGAVPPSLAVEPARAPIELWLRPPPPLPVPPVVSDTPTAQSAEGGSPASATVAPSPPTPPSPVPVRPARPTTRVPSVPLAPAQARPEPVPAVPALTVLSGGQLAGALRAGSGRAGTGGGSGAGDGAGAGDSCDMVARLEAALRDDAEINAAVAAVPGAAAGAVLVWNGDWIQSPGQAGKGLATVRQAIALEVAFAPPACRATAVRGLALIRLAEGPDAPRLALGKAAWRWSDLVSTRR
ncbi:hypothetical protein BZG35_00470 [Brevundimonas sp. LM2]|uniref:hypothetical protein n=1 Tax=Brevundimonas sp. LM2 TaxID=1938605 RepID=UPI000983C551|nr:hypothetical protein [Brevundimonas sp. LM2]AQR60296.1 hypothetical protein BZG35_00470 [Brevundimonas sp. LM2]